MEKYTMTAKCVSVGAIQEIGTKGFRKREIVLCEDEHAKYPHHLAWELKNDRVDYVSESDEGKLMTVTGYPESRQWQSKDGTLRTFTSMTAISVKICGEDIPEPAEPTEDDISIDTEDIPF